MAKQKSTPDAASVPLFKYGDHVRIRYHEHLQGRVVELRGALGPGGCQVYRVRIRGMSKPNRYAKVREDQLIPIPAESEKATPVS